MVYVVKKKIGKHHYLYLQRSLYNKGKRTTEYVAYLGKESAVTQEQIKIALKKYTEVGKDENR